MRTLTGMLAALAAAGVVAAVTTGGSDFERAEPSAVRQEPPHPTSAADGPSPQPADTFVPARPDHDLLWIAAGGGPVPELNQVSIEQDLALAGEVFGERGRILFAGGPGGQAVQVLRADVQSADPLRFELADLFAPRGGRDATYRATVLPTDAAATAANVRQTVREAVRRGPEPLLLYLGGHGDRGDAPADNAIVLWEQSALTVRHLTEELDRAQRPVRVVATTCYSGGFAEMVFRGADQQLGLARGTRCGLFATTWDLEASGCDPDPDRLSQDGYGLHFLNALRGRDRTGNPIDIATLDLDGDGAVSLLEAHTRARTVSLTLDVPTTTSERWLRLVAPRTGPAAPVELAEEQAVVRVIGQRLALQGREAAARARLDRLEQEIESLGNDLEAANDRESDAYRIVAGELLGRWPVLDDPWHPDFISTFTRDRRAIEAHLGASESYAAWSAAREEVGKLASDIADRRRQAAQYERLLRAVENVQMAGRLRARGGSKWIEYQRLLACERWIPDHRTRGPAASTQRAQGRPKGR